MADEIRNENTEIHSNDGYVVVNGVSRRFKKDHQIFNALEDIHFNVKKGEMVCIVGASGCGKSTLLRAISGLDPDHDGEVYVDGKLVTKPEISRGMVFQEPRLFPWLSVFRNVAFAITLKNGDKEMNKEIREKLVLEHIDLVGLKGFEKAFPRQLSGGMAQRAGIARALVNNPPLLLLDEPFGALDTFTKMTMQEELKRIQEKSKTTMIMVTHDIEEAVFLSDRVIVLTSRPGRIKEIVNVDLPYPRDRNSLEFVKIRKHIFDLFFEEATK